MADEGNRERGNPMTTQVTVLLCSPTTIGRVGENDRACGSRLVRFGEVRHVGPVIETAPGYWSSYAGQPTIKPIPNGSGLYFATFCGPVEQVEAFAAETARMDHYHTMHSSMWSGPVSPKQAALAGMTRCGCCNF